jgi:DNA polymerase-3 subunit alpha/error-prone DNA polymerase
MSGYVELNLRSAYSLLYGTRSVAELLDEAVRRGVGRLALTDLNGLYGVHEFIAGCAERGLRPIIGAELRLGGDRAVALVRDRRGYANLCRLLSDRAADPAFDLAAAVAERSGGLTLATDRPGLLERWKDRAERLYAAITPTSGAVLPAARRLGLPVAVLGDALWLDADDYGIHRALRAIALNKTVGNLAAGDTAAPDAFWRPAAEIERRLAAWPEALAATAEIADECVFDRIFDGWIFPAYAAPGGRSPAAELRARALAGTERRYGEIPDAVQERLDYELAIIEAKGFADYFLTVDDIVGLASRTCGRGSGAASLVAYSLGITNVDPLEHRLYFERFLNPSRPDPPDIDIDFAWDERDAVMRAAIARFGAESCARVANHNKFRGRSALREVAKAYGLGDAEISAWLDRRRFGDADEAGGGTGDADRDGGAADGPASAAAGPQAPGGPVDADPWPEIRRIAGRLVGLPRGLGMHCGGLVIVGGDLRGYAPVERSAEGYPLLAWEKEGAEAAGLVKIDLLGNRSLAVIRDCLAALEAQGKAPDSREWRPVDDLPTQAALARGDSLGVFYIESPAMRQLQKKTGAGDYAHIVIHSSIIRPAANKYIAEYVRRLKGEPYAPLHPRLDKILEETYGILCYQEDVSKAAVALAGFDEATADQLRKIIAKKAGSAKLDEFAVRFAAGCRDNGVDEATVEAVWGMMLSFSGYSFCKPHSASYAMVSFQSAYLRVHHPAEFMAAVISNQGGFYTCSAYVSEARRMGLVVAGPDVGRSRWHWEGRGRELVAGLMAVAGLSRATADAVSAERDRAGSFASLADFTARVRPARDEILALAAAGAFDSLSGGRDRPGQARLLLTAPAEAAGGQAGLFAADGPSRYRTAAPPPAYPPAGAASPDGPAALRAEYRTLGFLRDHHPLRLWRRELAAVRRPLARAVFGDEPRIGRRVELVAWPVTQKEVLTAEGRPMDFVSFEDESALFETVLFPEAYARYRRWLYAQRPLRLSGRVECDQGAVYLNIASIAPL